ncbi:hypothetical protein Dimus_032298, partial [Dionaea muscipula]
MIYEALYLLRYERLTAVKGSRTSGGRRRSNENSTVDDLSPTLFTIEIFPDLSCSFSLWRRDKPRNRPRVFYGSEVVRRLRLR